MKREDNLSKLSKHLSEGVERKNVVSPNKDVTKKGPPPPPIKKK